MSEQMEILANVAKRQQGELSILNKLSAKIFEGGAVLTCPICGRTKEKTVEEMAKYMKSWPACKGTKESPHDPMPASVKIK